MTSTFNRAPQKFFLLSGLALVGVALFATPAMAQTAAPKSSTASKAPAKPVVTKRIQKKPASASRVQIHSHAGQMAAGIRAAEEALTPQELAIAERIHLGTLPCELGASVTVASDPAVPGYFNVQGKSFKYRMQPVMTSTGAIRLEDRKAGAVWLQLANKSMLMNQKAGQRMADECMSPAQMEVAQAMKTSTAPGLLDAPVMMPAVAPALPVTPPAMPAAPAMMDAGAMPPAMPAAPATPVINAPAISR
jgi:hypothetical protein